MSARASSAACGCSWAPATLPRCQHRAWAAQSAYRAIESFCMVIPFNNQATAQLQPWLSCSVDTPPWPKVRQPQGYHVGQGPCSPSSCPCPLHHFPPRRCSRADRVYLRQFNAAQPVRRARGRDRRSDRGTPLCATVSMLVLDMCGFSRITARHGIIHFPRHAPDGTGPPARPLRATGVKWSSRKPTTCLPCSATLNRRWRLRWTLVAPSMP